MNRFHADVAVIRRNHREHLRLVHDWPKVLVDCPCDLQAGRFRKRHALGCGRPRCRLCHPYKWPRQPSRSERRSAIVTAEQLAELDSMR